MLVKMGCTHRWSKTASKPGDFWASTPWCFPDTSRKTCPAGAKPKSPHIFPQTIPRSPISPPVRRCQVNIRIANKCRCHLNLTPQKSRSEMSFCSSLIWFGGLKRLKNFPSPKNPPKIWPCHLWLKKKKLQISQIFQDLPLFFTFYIRTRNRAIFPIRHSWKDGI